MQNGHRPDNVAVFNGNQDRVFDMSSTRTVDAGVVSEPETVSPSAVFQLTDRLPIFTYLVNASRIRWYRVIMRFFFHAHRELYRYQLTAQEVRDAVRATLEEEYTLEQCQNDLAALKEWGNITTIYDSSRATSISSFLAPALLYQATPEAIAIETFLEEQMRASTGKGALRQGDLPHLWQALQSLDEDLRTPPEEYSPEHGRFMAEEWQRAFEIWNTMAREAAQYLANMIQAAQQGRPDFDAYQAYKAAVVAYVHGFAQSLTLYSRRIRALLAQWIESGRRDRLVNIVAEYLEPPAPTLEQRTSREELLEEASNQFNALANWFALGKNADSFRRNALAEVDKVVRRASVLAATARPNANYAANLHILATQLLKARDGDTAQQLFSLAFANMLPVHLPEGLAGRASARNDAVEADVWHQPPAVNLRLRPVSRANRGEHNLEDPVIVNSAGAHEIIKQYEEKLQQEMRRFADLFATPLLDLGSVKQMSVDERAIVVTIIDGCLGDARHQYRAPDGSTITLLNPDEQSYTILRAPDGMLLLPRYRLLRESGEEERA